MPDPIVANARPAATVVVLRDGPAGPEVFMVRRHEGTAFMGGAHVFPGGRVDPADGDADSRWCDGIEHAIGQLSGLPPADALAYHVAAARELFEEAGVLLGRHPGGDFVSLAAAADHERLKQDRTLVHDGKITLRAVVEREGLRLALDTLVMFAHWVTPPIDSRQFDTRFFMTRVPPLQTPAHDETETTHSLWARPADAIAQAGRDEIVLPPPTWSTLREIEPFESVKDALAWARGRTVVRRMPKAVEQDGRRMLLLPGDPLHPDPGGDDPPRETRFVLIDRRWRAVRPPRRIRPMKKIAFALLLSVSVLAQESVNEGVVAQIKSEAFQRSEVMDTLSWLSDVHGPRLTGSPELRKAAEWARDQLTKWGMANAALEPNGTTSRGWSIERFSIEMTEPQYMRITGYPRAWSPALTTPLNATPIVVEVKSKDDFDKVRGKLRGAIVMNGRPETLDIGFQAEAKRLIDEELKKQEGQIDPAAPGFSNAPRSYWDEEDEFVKGLEKQKEIYEFFAKEGIAALVTPSGISEDVRTDGFYDHIWHPTYPGFVISREHYGRIVRLIDRKQPVKLSLALAVKTTDAVDGFNVVAEIPGSDPALRSEVVMLGGHLDSWHSGTGATDNGAGCAVALEAMRVLKAIGARPRRTIRVALWTGEEQDYFGSMGYVEKHFGTLKTVALKPEHAKLSGYFNLDNGSGRIRGVNLQGNEAVRPIFEAWLRPFNYLGASTLTTLNTGGTDHMPFDAIGLPGFQFIQDPLNYESKVHHSNLDLYEEAVPDDLKQASAILASFVYHAAMRDAMLPRKPLPKPHTDAK